MDLLIAQSGLPGHGFSPSVYNKGSLLSLSSSDSSSVLEWRFSRSANSERVLDLRTML